MTEPSCPSDAARLISKIRQRNSNETDKVTGAEVGRALLSATYQKDAHIKSSLNNFSDPITSANEKKALSKERLHLQSQILLELDTFLRLADLPLLRLKLLQQQQQNRKLLQRNKRIAKRTTDSLIRAAQTGDSSVLLSQLTPTQLESIKIASMSLSGGENGGEGEKGSGGSGGSVGSGCESGSFSVSMLSNVCTINKYQKQHQYQKKHQIKDKAKASNRRRTSKKSAHKNNNLLESRKKDANRGRELLRSKDVISGSRSRSLPTDRELNKT
jgi:hypothetical protein